jgi:hypothetical protein
VLTALVKEQAKQQRWSISVAPGLSWTFWPLNRLLRTFWYGQWTFLWVIDRVFWFRHFTWIFDEYCLYTVISLDCIQPYWRCLSREFQLWHLRNCLIWTLLLSCTLKLILLLHFNWLLLRDFRHFGYCDILISHLQYATSHSFLWCVPLWQCYIAVLDIFDTATFIVLPWSFWTSLLCLCYKSTLIISCSGFRAAFMFLQY